MVAEGGEARFLLGGPIDGHSFADHVLIADYDLGIRAAVADILRLAAQDSPWKDAIVLANCDPPHDGDVIEELTAAANAHLGTNHAERADPDFIVQLGTRIDDRAGFDVDGHPVF